MNKKIIAFSLVSLCLSSCDWIWPFGEDLDSSSPISYTEWHLQNTTGEQIILHRYYEKIRTSITIPQNTDTILNDFYIYTNETSMVFSNLWDGRVDSVATQANSKITSIWRKSDINNSGKQFFNESSWTKSSKYRENKPCTIWTFEILPEDIE